MAHRSKRPDKRRPYMPQRRQLAARTDAERELSSPIEIALHRAAALLPTERAELLAPVREAFAAFRRGQGNVDAWAQLSDTLNIATELAQRQIVSNHKASFAAGSAALAAVFTRREHTGSWTLRGEEIAALDLALDLFAIQLDFCSRGELGACVTRVVHRIEQARAGNAAPGVRVCDPSHLFAADQAAATAHATANPTA